MELRGSKTEKNLWEAFAGESQARNKYTYYASNQGNPVQVVLEQLKTGKPEISAQLTSAKKTSKTELRGILRKMSKKQK